MHILICRFLFKVKIAMVGKYTGLTDSYLSVAKVRLMLLTNSCIFSSNSAQFYHFGQTDSGISLSLGKKILCKCAHDYFLILFLLLSKQYRESVALLIPGGRLFYMPVLHAH